MRTFKQQRVQNVQTTMWLSSLEGENTELLLQESLLNCLCCNIKEQDKADAEPVKDQSALCVHKSALG